MRYKRVIRRGGQATMMFHLRAVNPEIKKTPVTELLPDVSLFLLTEN